MEAICAIDLGSGDELHCAVYLRQSVPPKIATLSMKTFDGILVAKIELGYLATQTKGRPAEPVASTAATGLIAVQRPETRDLKSDWQQEDV